MTGQAVLEPRRCWRCGQLPEAGGASLPCPRCKTVESTSAKRGPGPVGGLFGVLRGIRFLNRHPRLWTWVVIPLILNGVVFGLVFFWTRDWAGQWVPALDTEWWTWIEWLRESLQWVLPKIMTVVVFAAALISTLLVSSLVNAPFYDVLSEKVEVAKLERPELARPWSKMISDITYSTWCAAYLAVRQLCVMAVLFVLSFTAVGAPIFVAAGFFFTGYALVDIPLARKRYDAGERIRWGRRRWLHLMGLGLPITFLPPLAPFGIVGATLAYLDQPDKG